MGGRGPCFQKTFEVHHFPKSLGRPVVCPVRAMVSSCGSGMAEGWEQWGGRGRLRDETALQECCGVSTVVASEEVKTPDLCHATVPSVAACAPITSAGRVPTTSNSAGISAAAIPDLALSPTVAWAAGSPCGRPDRNAGLEMGWPCWVYQQPPATTA